MHTDESRRIGKLNDRFRRSVLDPTVETEPLGRGLLTQGVATLEGDDRLAAIEAVRTFDTFTNANDPYGERDFGSIEQSGHKLFWKIDVYADATCRAGAETPDDPARSYRVLTVMLASEY